jgi:endonuclease/exonuclease/phosphatase (EEP) superfamily protein YafD
MALWKTAFWLLFAVALATICASFFGALHPAGDSLAVFRNHIAGIGALWILLGWATGVASPAWLGVMGLAVLPALVGYTQYEFVSPQSDVAIYQKNMLFLNPDPADLEADIRTVSPDILTLQEVPEEHAHILDDLHDILPYAILCDYGAAGAVAVASRWPAVEGSRICQGGFAALQVESPDGPLWVASLHLDWPWPEHQVVQLNRLLPVLEWMEGPAVLGGDFNMVPWSSTMRRMTAALGAERAGKVRPSYQLNRPGILPIFKFVSLPIDHVLIPSGKRGASELRPLLGSDHRGLVVRY